MDYGRRYIKAVEITHGNAKLCGRIVDKASYKIRGLSGCAKATIKKIGYKHRRISERDSDTQPAYILDNLTIEWDSGGGLQTIGYLENYLILSTVVEMSEPDSNPNVAFKEEVKHANIEKGSGPLRRVIREGPEDY